MFSKLFSETGFLCVDLAVLLSWNSLCRLGWPWIQSISHLSSWSNGDQGLCQHSHLSFSKLKDCASLRQGGKSMSWSLPNLVALWICVVEDHRRQEFGRQRAVNILTINTSANSRLFAIVRLVLILLKIFRTSRVVIMCTVPGWKGQIPFSIYFLIFISLPK